jgi:nitrate reductase (NAD(P)H)
MLPAPHARDAWPAPRPRPPHAPQDLHVPAAAVDPKDADTPDSWVRRDPRIQRLTGRHPLNCEPTMGDLMGSGFITPPSLHYVRNHGAVPRLQWGTHR